MKVKALRGVCIGVGHHLKVGDTVDLESALVTFLVGIGAVEVVKEKPPKTEPPKADPVEPPSKSAPANAGGKEK